MTTQEFLDLFAKNHEVKILQGAIEKSNASIYCKGLTGFSVADGFQRL